MASSTPIFYKPPSQTNPNNEGPEVKSQVKINKAYDSKIRGRIQPITKKEGNATPRIVNQSQILQTSAPVRPPKPLPTPPPRAAFSHGDVNANQCGVKTLTGNVTIPLKEQPKSVEEKQKSSVPNSPIAMAFSKAKENYDQAKANYEHAKSLNGTDDNSKKLLSRLEKQVCISQYEYLTLGLALTKTSPQNEKTAQNIEILEKKLTNSKADYVHNSMQILQEDINDKIKPFLKKPNLNPGQAFLAQAILAKFESLQTSYKTSVAARQNLDSTLSSIQNLQRAANAIPVSEPKPFSIAPRHPIDQRQAYSVDQRFTQSKAAGTFKVLPTPPSKASTPSNNSAAASTSSSASSVSTTSRPPPNPLINRTRYLALRRDRTEKTQLTDGIKTILKEGRLEQEGGHNKKIFDRPPPPSTPHPDSIQNSNQKVDIEKNPQEVTKTAALAPQLNDIAQPQKTLPPTPIEKTEITAVKVNDATTSAMENISAVHQIEAIKKPTAEEIQKTEAEFYKSIGYVNHEIHTTEATFNTNLKVEQELLMYFDDAKINNLAASTSKPAEFAKAFKELLNASKEINKFSDEIMKITNYYEKKLADNNLTTEEKNKINLEYSMAFTKIKITNDVKTNLAIYSDAYEKLSPLFNEAKFQAAWLKERDNFLNVGRDEKTGEGWVRQEQLKTAEKNNDLAVKLNNERQEFIKNNSKYALIANSNLPGDLLITVIQRFPRYELLVGDLLKKTEDANRNGVAVDSQMIDDLSRLQAHIKAQTLGAGTKSIHEELSMDKPIEEKKPSRMKLTRTDRFTQAFKPSDSKAKSLTIDGYQQQKKEFSDKIALLEKDLSKHGAALKNELEKKPTPERENEINEELNHYQNLMSSFRESLNNLINSPLGQEMERQLASPEGKINNQIDRASKALGIRTLNTLTVDDAKRNALNNRFTELQTRLASLTDNAVELKEKITKGENLEKPSNMMIKDRQMELKKFENELNNLQQEINRNPRLATENIQNLLNTAKEKLESTRKEVDLLESNFKPVWNKLVTATTNASEERAVFLNSYRNDIAGFELQGKKIPGNTPSEQFFNLLQVQYKNANSTQEKLQILRLVNDWLGDSKFHQGDLYQNDVKNSLENLLKNIPDTGPMKAALQEKFNKIESNFKKTWDTLVSPNAGFNVQREFLTNYRNEINKYELLGKPIPGDTPSEKLFNLFAQEYKKASPEQKEQILAMIGDWLSDPNLHLGDVTNSKVQAAIKNIIDDPSVAETILATAISHLKYSNDIALNSNVARFRRLENDLTSLLNNTIETKSKIAKMTPQEVSTELGGKTFKEWIEIKSKELKTLENAYNNLIVDRKNRAGGKSEEIAPARLAPLKAVINEKLEIAKALTEYNYKTFWTNLMNPSSPKEKDSSITKAQNDFLLTYRNNINKFELNGVKIPGKNETEQLLNLLSHQMKQGTDAEKLQIIAMMKEWVENPYMNGGESLNINIQNLIKENLKNVTNNSSPELKDAKESLEKVLAYQRSLDPSAFTTELKQGSQSFDDLIERIASKGSKTSNYENIVQNFANDLKKTTFHHMGQLTSADFVLDQPSATKTALEDHTNSIKNLAVQAILSQNTPEEAGKVLAFFIDVQQKLLENNAASQTTPDLTSAFSLSLAFANTYVEGRIIANRNVKFSDKQKENLKKYSIDSSSNSIFNPLGGYKALRQYIADNPNAPIVFSIGFQSANQSAEVLKGVIIKDDKQINQNSIANQAQVIRTDIEKMAHMTSTPSLTFDMKTPVINLFEDKTSQVDGKFNQSAFDEKIIAKVRNNPNLNKPENK
jgi:hypothetical protein